MLNCPLKNLSWPYFAWLISLESELSIMVFITDAVFAVKIEDTL